MGKVKCFLIAQTSLLVNLFEYTITMQLYTYSIYINREIYPISIKKIILHIIFTTKAHINNNEYNLLFIPLPKTNQ